MARGLAILAVLFIHGTSRAVTELDPASAFYPLYVVLNRGSQFAVPLFFLISALVLTYQLGDRAGVDWREFYVKRLRQVGVPYLAWTTFYVAARVFFLDEGRVTLGRFVGWYLTGKGWFHLYFLAVLIQFYAVFPLVHRFRRALSAGRGRPGFGRAFALLLGLQAAFYWVDRSFIRPHYPYSTLLSYVIPLGLGLWLGSNTDKWGTWWRANRWFVGAGALGSGLVYVSLNLAANRLAPGAAGGMVGWAAGGPAIHALVLPTAFYVYVALASLTVMSGARTAARDQAVAAGTAATDGGRPAVTDGGRPLGGDGRRAVRAGGGLVRWLGRLGEASFGIYLIHPIFLALWERLCRPATPVLFHLSVAGGLVVMLAGSWMATWVIGRVGLRRLLLGNR